MVKGSFRLLDLKKVSYLKQKKVENKFKTKRAKKLKRVIKEGIGGQEPMAIGGKANIQGQGMIKLIDNL